MNKLDEDILRAYFRMQEARRQRVWMERIWHPENFKWKEPPGPLTTATKIKYQELAKMGFDENYYQAMLAKEESGKADLESFAEIHTLWPHVELIKGLGKTVCGCFIAAAGDIVLAPTVSAFWKGMGLGLDQDGNVPRMTRGKRSRPCLPHVSNIGQQIRSCILTSRGKLYHEFYLPNREKVDLANPDRAKIFNMKGALRLTQKVLYACLWREWRLAYGLPAPDPYAFAILKHDVGNMIRISDFYEDSK